MTPGADKQEPSPLDELSDRLDAARGVDREAEHSKKATGADLGRAFRVSSELLAGLFVGLLLGLGLDKLLGSAPWFMLVGIGLGFAAGLKNIGRALGQNGPGDNEPGEKE